MRGKRFSSGLRALWAILMVLPLVTSTYAVTEKVLHSFVDKDGISPKASLIFDAGGNLYSTTEEGGEFEFGTVFELMPGADGGWTEKVLHAFNWTDGAHPVGSLVFDAAGNLYGTAQGGGKYGLGLVFELMPLPGGNWAEKILHNFNTTDGSHPVAGLIFDAEGNLYGTTSSGGGNNRFDAGVVFELIPTALGPWVDKVLHIFGDPASYSTGADPLGNLIFDEAGNLYGTTQHGGQYGGGTAFELTPTASGGWVEHVLHSFGFGPGDAGAQPHAGLVFDSVGNLYGTTGTAGVGDGTAFELSRDTNGDWKAKELHAFTGDNDGGRPLAGLVLDGSGNLYGTTIYGNIIGSGSNDGTVFKLTPLADGGWTTKILYGFPDVFINGEDVPGPDGGYPTASLILDAAGNLYGTTSAGGKYQSGTVYEIIP